MPLLVGSVHATVTALPEVPPPSPSTLGAADERQIEIDARARSLAAERFDRERRIDQRDPDRLGGH